jgi:hypothetical protein
VFRQENNCQLFFWDFDLRLLAMCKKSLQLMIVGDGHLMMFRLELSGNFDFLKLFGNVDILFYIF